MRRSFTRLYPVELGVYDKSVLKSVLFDLLRKPYLQAEKPASEVSPQEGGEGEEERGGGEGENGRDDGPRGVTAAPNKTGAA